jgi:hypothetical protein
MGTIQNLSLCFRKPDKILANIGIPSIVVYDSQDSVHSYSPHHLLSAALRKSLLPKLNKRSVSTLPVGNQFFNINVCATAELGGRSLSGNTTKGILSF